MNQRTEFFGINRAGALGFILLLLMGAAMSAGPNEDLLVAAKAGDLAAVNRALASGANINAKDRNGWTALQTAAANGSREIIRVLISKRADVNAKDNYGGTALMWGVGVTAPPDIAELLIAAGADVNAKNNTGSTILMSTGRPETAELLIQKGADVNAKDNDGKTALMSAVTLESVQFARLFVTHGADVNAKDKNGWTPLLLASKAEIVGLLIAAGADVHATHATDTALMNAANKDNVEAAKLLLAAGADIHAKNYLGVDALLAGALQGSTKMVAFLIDSGVDVNERLADDVTPLIWAAGAGGHVETVRLLIDKGADVNARDRHGNTALSAAELYRRNQVADVLKAAGAR